MTTAKAVPTRHRPDAARSSKVMRRSYARTVRLAAQPKAIFERLDDQTRLAEHMEQPSAMMGGGRMTYEFDAGRGQAVGSHIKMDGSAFGLFLLVDEVVTARAPPRRKVWRTAGATHLIVVGGYEMGFEIRPVAEGSELRVWIDYDLAATSIGRSFGPILAPVYARWCVDRMASDAVKHFSL